MGRGTMRWGLVAMLILLEGCARQWSTPTPVSIDAGETPSHRAVLPLPQSEVLAMLAADRFADLDAYFSARQRDYVEGAISDEALRNVFRAFYATSAALEPKYVAWVEQFPKSYVAHLARGIYYKKVGQERGGDATGIDQASPEQIAAMEAAYAKALDDFHVSADLNEKPLLTYLHAMDISNSARDVEQSRQLLDLSIRIDPTNFVVRQKYLLSLEPRWGGSVGQMQAFLKECRGANLPAARLSKLEAILVEDQATVAFDEHHYANAASGYLKTIDMGGEVSCLDCAAYAMAYQKQYDNAVRVYTMILVQRPSDTATLADRAYAYSQLKNPLAIQDYTAAANLGDAYSQDQLGRYNFDGVPGLVTRDREAGIRWFRMAAAHGYPQGVKSLENALAHRSSDRAASEGTPSGGGLAATSKSPAGSIRQTTAAVGVK